MTPEQARALLRAPDLLAAASAHDLRTAERLRRSWPAELVAAASEQAELRARARAKSDDVDGLLLTRAGLEQASPDVVARHRAERFAGVEGVVADLCCGIGFDLRALAAVTHAVGVDRDETAAVCARHNSGAPVAVGDVLRLRVGGVAAVFVDPARRDTSPAGTGGRGGSQPPLSWCFDLPVGRVAVKAAPGLEVNVVPAGWELEFVAVGRDLKEACVWSPTWATATRRATVIAADGVHALVGAPEDGVSRVQAPGGHVLDPSPAVTRAGLVRLLAVRLDAWQIDEQIAFLSADHPLQSAFGRALDVQASLPFSVKALAAELRRLEIGTIDLRRRGLAGDVDDLRRRLRPRGPRTAVVLLTRVHNRPWTLVCTERSSS